MYAYKDVFEGKAHIPTPWRYSTGVDFTHFGVELGMVFEETTGMYERICCFNSKWTRKKA